jgi:Tol biopolymer transport system component
MSADGSGIVGLTGASGFASPTWSPDGQVIAYASANAIEWVSADGSLRGRIIDNGHSPAWRP